MEYKYEVTSLVGFLQRVATHLLPKGYYFFVQGTLPEGKSPQALDEKFLSRYDVAKTEGARRWRKTQGLGNVQYVRFNRSWILLATHGDHAIREGEGDNLKDVRRVPVRIGDYTLYIKRGNYLKKVSDEDQPTPDGRWRVRVLIAREPYRELCAYYLSVACHRRAGALAQELYSLPYEPYAPVRKQLLKLLRLINAKRRAAGYTKIPVTCLRFKRKIVRAFDWQNARCNRDAANNSMPLGSMAEPSDLAHRKTKNWNEGAPVTAKCACPRGHVGGDVLGNRCKNGIGIRAAIAESGHGDFGLDERVDSEMRPLGSLKLHSRRMKMPADKV